MHNGNAGSVSRGQTKVRLLTEKDLGVSPSTVSAAMVARNAIYFGPPGTGKSRVVADICVNKACVRTQFHPEYTYSDFVGSYRPVVGHEVQSPIPQRVISVAGVPMARPVSYFDFVPGPFVEALVQALKNSSEHVFLVIEEINRGDCAAIFGDVFQLLDREEDGSSTYSVRPRPELAQYLSRTDGIDVWHHPKNPGQIYIPHNLSLLATMNTSDRSLFPMDAAFKRRWDWEFVGVEFPPGEAWAVADGKGNAWNYITLVERVNEDILSAVGEDKLIGPRFISPDKSGLIDFRAVVTRLFYYLWHDVFRDLRGDPRSPFKADIRTFGNLQRVANTEGLAKVFRYESALFEFPQQAKAASLPGSPGLSFREPSGLGEGSVSVADPVGLVSEVLLPTTQDATLLSQEQQALTRDPTVANN